MKIGLVIVKNAIKADNDAHKRGVGGFVKDELGAGAKGALLTASALAVADTVSYANKFNKTAGGAAMGTIGTITNAIGKAATEGMQTIQKGGGLIAIPEKAVNVAKNVGKFALNLVEQNPKTSKAVGIGAAIFAGGLLIKKGVDHMIAKANNKNSGNE